MLDGLESGTGGLKRSSPYGASCVICTSHHDVTQATHSLLHELGVCNIKRRRYGLSLLLAVDADKNSDSTGFALGRFC